MRRRRGNLGGFTIVEALLAGVVLTLSASVLGLAVSQAMRSLTAARDYQQAAELLDRTLTKVDMIGPTRLYYEGPAEGVFDSPHERFAWRVAVSPVGEGDLYEVTVSVMWPRPGGSVGSASATTLLNDPQGARSALLGWDNI